MITKVAFTTELSKPDMIVFSHQIINALQQVIPSRMYKDVLLSDYVVVAT